MVRLIIDGSKQALTFSACHVIQGHTKCGRLHGHNYAVSVMLEGDIENGMLMDFGPLKKAIRVICKEVDHRMLVPAGIVSTVGDQMQMDIGGKHYSFPASDAYVLPLDIVSAERLSEWFLSKLVETVEFPVGVRRVEIRVDESDGQGAWTGRDL